jgi:hypothetical protein
LNKSVKQREKDKYKRIKGTIKQGKGKRIRENKTVFNKSG